MGVIPEHVDSPTTQAGAEAGAGGQRWYGGRPPLVPHFFDLICKMAPEVEEGWLPLAELWAIGIWLQYLHMGVTPELACGPSPQEG